MDRATDAQPTGGVMIDRPGSEDRDDAFVVVRRPAGSDGRSAEWHATVHIAAIAPLIPVDSEADRTARQRVRSRYLSDRTLRMLPTGLERRASLTSKRETLRFDLRFGVDGDLLGCEITPGRLQYAAALGYEEAAAAINDRTHSQHRALVDAHALATTLLARRRAGGALAAYDVAHGWATDEEGNVVRLGTSERNAAYIVVQELMIAANAAAAQWCAERELPILYRNHRVSTVAPPREKLLDDLTSVETDPVNARLEAMRERFALIQRPAVYEPHVAGHYGLNLAAYTHATSPLRRYADLVNQRILFAAAAGLPSPHPAEELATIGEEITAKLVRWREDRAEHFRAVATVQTQKRLESRSFRPLSATDFHKLVEAAIVEPGPPPALVDEVVTRIEQRTLPVKDICRVLFFGAGPEWASAREAALAWVESEPEHAITVVTMYASLARRGRIEWRTDDLSRRGSAAVFSSQGTLGSDTGPSRLAGSKRDARQQAALGLVATLTGLSDRSHDLASTSGEVIRPPAPMPDIPAGQNPVATVNHLAQLNILRELSWSYDRVGPDHEPSFDCTLHAVDGRTESPISVRGTAGSKKAAQSAAAESAIALLQHSS